MDLSAFEFIAGVGTTLVVVGVSSEAVEVLEKLAKAKPFRIWLAREGSPRWLFAFLCVMRRMRPVALWIEGIGLGIVIAGLAIEWFGTNAANRIQSTTDLELKYKTALLESNNIALEGKLAPRIITTAQITDFIFLTSKTTKIPIKVCLSQTGDDPESETFAYQIRNLLNQAHFQTNADAEIWGITHGQNILLRKTERQKEWPDALFVYFSTNSGDSPTAKDLDPGSGILGTVNNPDGRQIAVYTGNKTLLIYSIVMASMRVDGIRTEWLHGNEYVQPGECEINVVPKAFYN
jgi:hypothetical protein